MSVTWKKALFAAALAAAWWLGACGGKAAALHENRVNHEEPENPRIIEDPDVEIIATDFAFEPNEIELEAYQTTSLQLRNEGERPHSIAFKLPDREITATRILGPQDSVRLSFEAPATPGQYTFYCPVGDHRERGMVGTLIVH